MALTYTGRYTVGMCSSLSLQVTIKTTNLILKNYLVPLFHRHFTKTNGLRPLTASRSQPWSASRFGRDALSVTLRILYKRVRFHTTWHISLFFRGSWPKDVRISRSCVAQRKCIASKNFEKSTFPSTCSIFLEYFHLLFVASYRRRAQKIKIKTKRRPRAIAPAIKTKKGKAGARTKSKTGKRKLSVTGRSSWSGFFRVVYFIEAGGWDLGWGSGAGVADSWDLRLFFWLGRVRVNGGGGGR